MNSIQENVAVLVGVLFVATIMAVLVATASSQRLREEGLRRLIKRWLGR